MHQVWRATPSTEKVLDSWLRVVKAVKSSFFMETLKKRTQMTSNLSTYWFASSASKLSTFWALASGKRHFFIEIFDDFCCSAEVLTLCSLVIIIILVRNSIYYDNWCCIFVDDFTDFAQTFHSVLFTNHLPDWMIVLLKRKRVKKLCLVHKYLCEMWESSLKKERRYEREVSSMLERNPSE